jgi:hypothetical protein
LPADPNGQLTDQVRTGIRVSRYDKPCVVDPRLDLEWYVGRHEINVAGAVAGGADDPLKLLHYRWFGREYCEQRSTRNFRRMSKQNKVNRFGFETDPQYSGPYSTAWYEQQLPKATDVLSVLVKA